jgi:hypothetical protein
MGLEPVVGSAFDRVRGADLSVATRLACHAVRNIAPEINLLRVTSNVQNAPKNILLYEKLHRSSQDFLAVARSQCDHNRLSVRRTAARWSGQLGINQTIPGRRFDGGLKWPMVSSLLAPIAHAPVKFHAVA